MKSREGLMSQRQYLRTLKNQLPSEVFKPRREKLRTLLLHLLILITGYLAIRFTQPLIIHFLISLVIANSLACIAFLSHDLSHNSIIRKRKVRYPLEVFSWGLNLIPATMWVRVHNHNHHVNANTERDPDRQFLKSEANAATRLYTRIFYPNRNSFRWNPFVGTHFLPYIFRNIISIFYTNAKKPRIVPYKAKFALGEKIRMIGESLIILIFQVAIWYMSGGTWGNYIWASPVPIVIVSFIVMAYVFTNHYLNPISETHDPIIGSTSVVVPKILDKLHGNFSYHTEHHLFPNVNPDFYPQISALLKHTYPDRYNRLHITEAWNRLWKLDEFAQ